MDFQSIAFSFLLLMGLLISLCLVIDFLSILKTSLLRSLVKDIDRSLQAIGWYPITDIRQYIILVIEIVLGYLLGQSE